MTSRIRRHLSYANVVATMALVFAMSGTAMAGKHYLINSTSQIKPSVLKTLKASTGTLKAILPYIKYVASGVGGKPTIQFSGANVQIVSGTGSDAAINGAGNVIVGYDETPGAQTGSDNVVLGGEQTYTSWGAILGGRKNTASGPLSVVFGTENVAEGTADSIIGGAANKASNLQSAVTGGKSGKASGKYSAVGGGTGNNATGTATSVTGGQENVASEGSVSGGYANHASAPLAAVLGGNSNTASGFMSAVAGGSGNQAKGAYSSILGGKSLTEGKEYGVSP